MNSQIKIWSRPAGNFHISKIDGSATYALKIDAPPGVRMIQPGLTIFYSSTQTEEPSIISAGWKIDGIPVALQRGEGKIFVDGNHVLSEQSPNGDLTVFDHAGNKAFFSKVSGKAEKSSSYQITRKEDAYGNCIIYKYDNQIRPISISYGTRKNQFGTIILEYGENLKGYLTSIKTLHNGNHVQSYDFQHENGAVSSIQISAVDAEDPSTVYVKPVIQLTWGSSNSDKNMLTGITETTGLRFVNSYQTDTDLKGILSQSSIVVGGLSSKPATYERIVNVDKLIRSSDGTCYARELVIWDCAESQGEYYKYSGSSNGTVNLDEEGKICNATRTPSGENGTEIPVTELDGGETNCHIITNRSFYEHLNHKTGVSLKSKKVDETYFEEALLISTTTEYQYDSEGNISRIHMPDTTAVFELQEAPNGANPYIRLPKRTSLFDTSDSKSLVSSSTLLKDDVYDYEFDSGGNVKTISHQTLIGGNQYSNKQLSELDEFGYTKKLTDTIGTTTETVYSEDFSKFTTTVTSADGKNSKSESSQSDKRHGNPVRTTSSDGNICVQKYDAFGEMTEIHGFDLSNPDSWKQTSFEKLIRLSKCETTFDKFLNLFCLTTNKTVDSSGTTNEVRLYVDALYRPVIEVKRIEKKKWQVSFSSYETAASANKTSIRYELRTTSSDLSKKIRGIKFSSIKWYEKKRDDFGRITEERQPDGTIIKNSWKRLDNNLVETTTTQNSKNGGLKSLSSQVIGPRGITESHNQSDSKPTKFEYDALGRVIKKTDPLNQVYTYKWNSFDTCIEEKNPITGTNSCTVGKTLLITEEYKNGEILKSDYDWLGRPKNITVQDLRKKPKQYSIDYFDDSDNRSTGYKLSHPDGWQTIIRFAPSGREIERTLVLGKGYSETVASTLTADGQISARTFPCKRSLKFDYNELGIMKGIEWAGSKKSVVKYDGFDPFGRPLFAQFGNGVSEFRDYDMYGNLHSFAVTKSIEKVTTPYLAIGYSPDRYIGGQVLARSSNTDGKPLSTNAFNYEKYGQLSLVLSEKETIVKQFDYGPADNLQAVVSGKDKMSFDTDKVAYQLSDVARSDDGLLSVAYNTSGYITRMKSGSSVQELAFDTFGNLAEYSTGDGKKTASIEFVTDLFGDRFLKASLDGTVVIDVTPDYRIIRKSDNTVLRTVKVAGPYGVFGEFTQKDKDNMATALFRQFPKTNSVLPYTLPKQLDGNGYCEEGDVYIHLDDLGSSLLTTDAKGQKSAVLAFDLHGEIDLENSKGAYNFTITYAGMSFDHETGLYFAGARYFSPVIKKFLSPDPENMSTDPYAYPSDPVNFFDGQGACRECAQYARNWASGFIRNIGRKLKRTGLVLTMGMVCFLAVPICAQYHDDTVPGSAVAYGVRWGLAIGVWFGMLIGAPALLANCNRNNSPALRSIAYCDDCRNTDNSQVLGPCAMTWIAIGTSTIIGMVFLGPLLCFIGWDCSALFSGGLGSGTYGYFALRGAIASAGAGCIKTAASKEICAKIKCLRTSITGRFIGSAAVIATGMWAWQLVDLSYVRIFYDTDTDVIWYGKERFILAEMAMLLLMANPNLIWSLLPAIFNCRKMDKIWDCCFKKPRDVFPANYDVVAHRGRVIPICCGSSPDIPLVVGVNPNSHPQQRNQRISTNTMSNNSRPILLSLPSLSDTLTAFTPHISSLNSPTTRISLPYIHESEQNDTSEKLNESIDSNLKKMIELQPVNTGQNIQSSLSNVPILIIDPTNIEKEDSNENNDSNQLDENSSDDEEKP